jgi:hypothetical protein
VTDPGQDDAPATRRGRGRRTPSTTEGTARAEPSIAPEPAPAVIHRAPWITEPCVVDGMTDEEYHRDPVVGGSLSHSRLKTVRDVPARAEYERVHGRRPKDHFDRGHVAHKMVLGIGPDVVVLPDGDGRTKAVRDAKAEARAAGKVPVKPDEWQAAQDMAAALRDHHTAGKLFVSGRGTAERSVFWFDDEFGIWRRARFDWCMRLADGRFAIVDYKTASGKVSPWALGKRCLDFGYHTQDAYYCDGARALDLADGDDEVAFLFVFQEIDAPHLVTVVELDAPSREQGRRDVADGLRRYVECAETGQWPDYAPDGPITVSIPAYGFRDYS